MIRRNLLWLVLALHALSLTAIGLDLFWPQSIESRIYDAVQWLQTSPTSLAAEGGPRMGGWVVSWWFFVALAMQAVTWLAALALASTERGASAPARLSWCAIILLAPFPAVAAYCIFKLLRPNNSFKPTPLRGAA